MIANKHFIILLIIVSCARNDNISSIQIKKLNYPSASTVEYVSGKLYVMGDDATNLFVLDTNLNVIDSIPVIFYPDRRIPKDIKPDLEASALTFSKGHDLLLLIGSLSVAPQRDRCWLYDLESNTIDSVSLKILHSLITRSGIEQVNIEGACLAFDYLVMANRGNKSYPKNHLIIGPRDLWKTDTSYHKITTIQVTKNTDTTGFSGISGLCHLDKANKLIMSVSTEDTRNVYEDGAIGKSYLWIINNFSTHMGNKTISPDRIIDLEEIDKRFKGYKIESVTVVSETNDLINLVLVADNDDGTSTIFKMNIAKD